MSYEGLGSGETHISTKSSISVGYYFFRSNNSLLIKIEMGCCLIHFTGACLLPLNQNVRMSLQMALRYYVVAAGWLPILQQIRDGGGKVQTGTTAKEAFYLMTVALKRPVVECVLQQHLSAEFSLHQLCKAGAIRHILLLAFWSDGRLFGLIIKVLVKEQGKAHINRLVPLEMDSDHFLA